jgi:hypothetical protein
MVFSSPSTLWALGLLAIPIIIHLFEFRRYKRLYFSDTSLFKEIKAQSQTKNRLKHLLILASRLLFLAALIFAFADPIIPGEEGTIEEPDIVSIYIDNSYSMTATGKNGSLINEALETAYRISEAYPAGMRFMLFSNELTANQKRLLSLQDFQTKLDALEPSRLHRSLEEVINFQAQALQESGKPRAQSYLISDFNGMLNEDNEGLTCDSNHRFRLIPLSADEVVNISIDSVWSDLPIHQTGLTETLHFSISNHGGSTITDQKVDVYINDALVASPIISLNAHESLDTALQFEVERAGTLKGRIHVDDAPITYDNDLYFTLTATDKIKVVEIADEQGAKSPFERLFDGLHYTHQLLDPDRIIQDSLGDAQLIIINGVSDWNLALTSITETYLNNGGNILLIPPSEMSEELKGEWSSRFKISFQTMDSIGSSVTSISPEQPLFKGVFASLDEDINLPTCKQAYRLNTPPGESILPLPNGRSLLGANTESSGKVYFLTTPLNKKFTNLAEHALFVPIMINMASRSGLGERLFFPLEESYIPWKGERREDWRMRKNDGSNTFIPGISFNGLLMNGQLESPGIYELYESAKDSAWASFAFNHNRHESALDYPDESELSSAFESPECATVSRIDLENAGVSIESADLGTQLWPWFVAMALLFILFELVLLKLFKP